MKQPAGPLPLNALPGKEELVKGVERLKGTAKGIDLASFIAEYRNWPKNMLFCSNLSLS